MNGNQFIRQYKTVIEGTLLTWINMTETLPSIGIPNS